MDNTIFRAYMKSESEGVRGQVKVSKKGPGFIKG